MEKTSISNLSAGYQRGVVFGLTMAEILLLLLFCLLVALYSVWRQVQDLESIEEIRTNEIENLKEENSTLKNLSATESKENNTLQENLRHMENRAANLEEENRNLKVRLDDHGGLNSEELRLLAEFKSNNPDAYERIVLLVRESGNPEKEVVLVNREQWEYLTAIRQGFPKAIQSSIVQVFNRNQLEELGEALIIIENGDWKRYVAILNNFGDLDNSEMEQVYEVVRLYRTLDPQDRQTFVNFKAGGPRNIEWPPIIFLNEAEDYSFPRGSAELSANFVEKLETDVLEHVKSVVDRYGVRIVEVVGHTDEEPVTRSRTSNLDLLAIPALKPDSNFPRLSAADNAGLGLARAISVTRVLQRLLAEEAGYSDVVVLPYSGGQLIDLNERLSSGAEQSVVKDPGRRRIEIRLRRGAY